MKPPDSPDPRGTLLMLFSVFLFAANTLLLLLRVLSPAYPIFAKIIAAVWLNERASRAALLWMFAGFAGLVAVRRALHRIRIRRGRANPARHVARRRVAMMGIPP